MLGDLEENVLWGQSWTASFAVLTSSRETVLACRGAEPLGTDPCSGREHLLGLAWAGCQRPGVQSSDLWVTVKGTQNCQVMEEGGDLPCVIHWETVRVQRGQECRGEAGTSRRGPSQGRGSDLSSTVSVPSSSGMFISWGCCNQSPHQTLKATGMHCLPAWKPESPDPGVGRATLLLRPQGRLLPSCLFQLLIAPAVRPLARGAASSFCLFFTRPSLCVWVPAPPAKDPVDWTEDPTYIKEGLPQWLSRRRICLQSRKWGRCGFDPGVGKILWRGKWQPALVFLPGKSHGQKRSLAGCSPRGHKESDATERLSMHAPHLG